MPISSRTPAGVVAVLLVVLFADGARAETVAETLARWGLLGTWATDCSRPPSQANHRLSYVARAGGRAFHERNFGNTRDSREIRAAALRPGGLIEVVADFGTLGGVRKWTMIKDADGRIRTLANSRIDGSDATITDGRLVVGSGAKTAWQTRCPVNPKGLREVRRALPRI
jgi:hypothetical protein